MTKQVTSIIEVLESYGFKRCEGSYTVYSLDLGYNRRLLTDLWGLDFFEDDDDIVIVLYTGLELTATFGLSSDTDELDEQLADLLIEISGGN